MEPIKETLSGLLKDIRVRKDKTAEWTPEALAKKAFSGKESQHLQAGNLKNGILYIKVDSSTWLYYFNLHKKELLEKLSGAQSPVKDLKFSLGQIKPPKEGG